ncbi:SNF2 family N-terminal domain-containing protein [Aspergillus cavernicola]|uniref:SNF2 family N-terminal domain-containing protein n=1 Tax=Aspergillus cavernicola TaxID=176166 RepID=A0ABR4HTK9_9EURO
MGTSDDFAQGSLDYPNSNYLPTSLPYPTVFTGGEISGSLDPFPGMDYDTGSPVMTPGCPFASPSGPQLPIQIKDDEENDSLAEENVAKLEPIEESVTEQDETISECETCFGEIIATTTSSFKGEPGKTSARVKIQPFGNVLRMVFADSGKYAGIISMPVLITILQQYTVQLVGTLTAPKAAQGAKSQPSGDPCIRIVVYGCSNERKAVGAALSEAEVFLQHPTSADCDLSMPYINPHYLLRPGDEMPNLEDLVLFDMGEDSNPSEPLAKDVKSKVMQIFDSVNVPIAGTYEPARISSRLAATLKEHQFVAVSMMVERESGRLDDLIFPALWESVRGKVQRYRHTITGRLETKPHPIRGGILADEMGLGKTLSLLALVCLSLDRFDEQPHGSQPRATLIVAPKSTIPGWETQIKTHVKARQVRYLVYHGAERRKSQQGLSQQYEIVITTYETIRRDWLANDGLYSGSWHRLVLDEAHRIRNRSSQIFKAVSSVKAHYRWCLTGTPIQNSLDDYGALLGFLQVPTFKDKPAFDHWIATPAKWKHANSLQNLRCLVAATAFRRTKAMVEATVKLPTKTEKIESVELSSADRELYEFFQGKASKTAIELNRSGQVESGMQEKKKENTLSLIGFMRLICNHGEQLLPAAGVNAWRTQQSQTGGNNNNISNSSTQQGNQVQGFDSGSIATASSGLNVPPSAKVKALLRNLGKEHRNMEGALGPGKSVVFSQWTKMLDLVAQVLCYNKYEYARIDGQSTLSARQSAMERFNNDDRCTVMLASIGSAAEGVDLTAACYVHLLEPQWNPMTEAQAVDRVHRIGQSRDVVVTRYLAANSIEDYVCWIQKDKMQVISESLGSAGVTQLQVDRHRWDRLQLAIGLTR